MNKIRRRTLFTRLREQNPKPTTELNYQSTFELLIAVILSAQATDNSVNKATAILFAKANTPETLLALGEETLKTYIKSIGLFNSKANNILKTCQLLIDHYHGEVPTTRAALEALPGVGRKTANVVLNTAFNQAVIPVDTHVYRVANRTGLAKGNTPVAVELQLLKNIEQEFLIDAHHWLVLHGRYVCTARKPHCNSCIIRDLCDYKQKTS
ncbi:MAG: endonuclease III [Legionella sp.]